MYNRKAFKQEAKQLIRASVPHFMLVTLVYYLLTSGLSILVDWLTSTFSLPYGGGMLGLFLNILVLLFSLVMGVGFANYSLRLSRKEETGWNSLFQPFSYSGRAMGMPLLVMLYSFLWYLLVITAAVILLVILIMPTMYYPSRWPVAAVGMVIVYIGAAAVLIFIFLRYAMAEFALADDPGAGALEAIRRSIRMLRGYKGKLFVMQLSFLGWELLVYLIAMVVIVIGLFASGSLELLRSMSEAILAANDGDVIYYATYQLIDTFTGRMFLWFLLAELLSLPLNLWVTVYAQTAYARFYNYVGGYDYHQFMIAQRAQTPPPPAQPAGPAPIPLHPSGPPIGGYYTPQPDLSEPPAAPAPPQEPEPPASAAEPEAPAEAPEEPAAEEPSDSPDEAGEEEPDGSDGEEEI